MGGAELRIDLGHLAENAAIALAETDGNFANLQIEKDLVDIAALHTVAERERRTQGWVARKGKLLIFGENADLDAVVALGGCIPGKDEGRFVHSGFSGDLLHFGVGESAGIRKDHKLVALQALRGEDVELDIAIAAGAVGCRHWPSGFWDPCDSCNEAGGSKLKEVAAGRFHESRW